MATEYKDLTSNKPCGRNNTEDGTVSLCLGLERGEDEKKCASIPNRSSLGHDGNCILRPGRRRTAIDC